MYKITKALVLIALLLLLIVCCRAQPFKVYKEHVFKPDSSMFWKGVIWAIENKKAVIHDTLYLLAPMQGLDLTPRGCVNEWPFIPRYDPDFIMDSLGHVQINPKHKNSWP